MAVNTRRGRLTITPTLSNAVNLPPGTMMPFAGTTAPAGWLLCAGQLLLQTDYPGLYAAVGATYNIGGEAVGTFRVPDLRGRTAVGKDDMGGTPANRMTTGGSGINGAALGAHGGTQTHSLSVAQLAAHDHGTGTLATVSAGAHTHGIPSSTATGSSRTRIPPQAGGFTDNIGGPTESAGAHTHSITGATGSSGSGTAHQNTQPSIILNYIVKV